MIPQATTKPYFAAALQYRNTGGYRHRASSRLLPGLDRLFAHTLPAIVILCSIGTVAQAAVPVPVDRDKAVAQAGAADASVARLAQLARNGDRAALLAELVAARDGHDLTPPARERLLRDGVLALATLPADSASRRFVEQLTTRPVAVRVWHSEGHEQVSVPLFDVAAAASSVLRQWNRAAVRDAAVDRALTGGPLVPAGWRQANASDVRVRGIADAVERLPAATLQRQREALARLAEAAPQWAPAIVPAAARLGDVELFVAVVRGAEPGDAVRALPKVATLADSTRALDVLRVAAERPAVASAALFEAGRLAQRDPSAVDWLFTVLGDRTHGGSAAAALARLDDPAVERRLIDVLTGTDDEPRRARAALALWLTGSAGAHEALRAFAAGDASHELRRQIAAWTAR